MLFLDSGAFTLRTTAKKYAEDNDCSYTDFYDTDDFWEYMDDYVRFIKEHQDTIDLYANVDVIPNPKLSWRNLKYLEEQGINPVPVVHYGASLKWLKRHVDEGYDLIGLGGLVGITDTVGAGRWLDEMFSWVCGTPDRLPRVRLHGFGVTTHQMLWRYPWWSVDSVTWARVGGYGGIYVPRKGRGKFDLSKPPYLVSISDQSTTKIKFDAHYSTMRVEKQKRVCEWLDLIGIPLGRMKDGEVVEHGVMTRHTERRAACILYFEELIKALPEWPWPFGVTASGVLKGRMSKGLGLR